MRISIITAAYNSEATIGETIGSVLGQSHEDIEYIIVDGGSTDKTLEIVNKYQIAKIISEPDQGIYDAMNKGIKLAAGEIIGILNSDDVYYDNDVLKNVAEVMGEKNADVCWGDLVYVKKDDLSKVTRFWRSSAYQPGLFRKGWHPPHPTFFVRKSIYEKYGNFRTDLKLAADYELMLRFLEKNKVPSVYIPRTLVKMREGGASNWKNIFKVIRGNMESLRAWKLNNLSINLLVFLLKPLRKISQIDLTFCSSFL